MSPTSYRAAPPRIVSLAIAHITVKSLTCTGSEFPSIPPFFDSAFASDAGTPKATQRQGCGNPAERSLREGLHAKAWRFLREPFPLTLTSRVNSSRFRPVYRQLTRKRSLRSVHLELSTWSSHVMVVGKSEGIGKCRPGERQKHRNPTARSSVSNFDFLTSYY